MPEQTVSRLYVGPDRLQSFGVLLAVDSRLDRVLWCSANSGRLLGIAPDELLQLSLDQIVGNDAVHEIGNALSLSTALLQREPAGCVMLKERRFTLWVHFGDGWPLVELEQETSAERRAFPTFNQLRSLLTRLEGGESLERCLGDAVVGLRSFTGFERVVIGRLESDDCEEVLAEARDPELTSLLGDRVSVAEASTPRDDLGSRLRIVAALDEPEVPLTTLQSDAEAPGLTRALLRGVLPADRQRLDRIGAGAFMNVHLRVGGEFWGTVDFHHRSAYAVDPDLRAAVEIVCKFLALQIERRSSEIQ